MKWLTALLVSLGIVAPAPKAPVEVAAPAPCAAPCAMSETGYSLVRTFEGYMPFPYKDVAGIETVGYGYVIRPGDALTYPLLPPAADALLKREMALFERDINHSVRVPVYQYQFDALASLTYNIGPAAFRGSTVLKRVNMKEHVLVPDSFLMWNKARIDGVLQPVRGLTLRRQEEANLYAGK